MIEFKSEDSQKKWELVEEQPQETGQVCEVFVGGQIKRAELLSDNSSNFGVFMHSLALSNEIDTGEVPSNDSANTLVDDERAMSQYSLNKGFDKRFLEKIAPKVTDVEKYMGENKPAVHMINDRYRMIAKGSPLAILEKCTHIFMETGIYKITRKLAELIFTAFWGMIERGLKVYALAIKDTSDLSEITGKVKSSEGMTLVGLVGIKRKGWK